MNVTKDANGGDALMTKDERQVLRDQIQDAMLRNLLELVKGGSADAKELRMHYDLKLAEQDCEHAAKRNEIAERKLAGAEEEREFTAEETMNGIRAMLGKGAAE